MIQRFCIKCMIFLLLLTLCLPIITDALDSFGGQFSSMGYDLGVDLSVRRLVRDPMGAVEDILNNAFDPDRIFNSLGEY